MSANNRKCYPMWSKSRVIAFFHLFNVSSSLPPSLTLVLRCPNVCQKRTHASAIQTCIRFNRLLVSGPFGRRKAVTDAFYEESKNSPLSVLQLKSWSVPYAEVRRAVLLLQKREEEMHLVVSRKQLLPLMPFT